MKHETYDGFLEQQIAALRARCPGLRRVGIRVEASAEQPPALSVCLDLRLPQHQIRVSGPFRGDLHAAATAAFELAAGRLRCLDLRQNAGRRPRENEPTLQVVPAKAESEPSPCLIAPRAGTTLSFRAED